MSAVSKAGTAITLGAPVIYMAYGRPADLKNNRAVRWRSDLGSPLATLARGEAVLAGRARKNAAITLIISFDKATHDPGDPDVLDMIEEHAYQVAKAIAPNAPVAVAVHTDSEGGHPHAHVVIVNHDLGTGKAARSSGVPHWLLKRENDRLLAEKGIDIVRRAELAHDVSRSRADEQRDVSALTVDELDKSTWREFLADRVDEALQDPRVVDVDSLITVAAEHGVSIRETRGKYATGLTYALVDDDGEVRRYGRSKAASTGTRLGSDYTIDGVTASIAQLREAEKEMEDVTSYDESSTELAAALERLERADGPRRRAGASGDSGGGAGGSADGGGGRDGVVEDDGLEDPVVDVAGLAALRAALARERAERDERDAERAREDGERAREDGERRARSEAAWRRERVRLVPDSTRDDAEARGRDDGPEF